MQQGAAYDSPSTACWYCLLALPSRPCSGHTVWEVPPPTAGVVAVMSLNILEAHRRAMRRRKKPEINYGKPGLTEWSSDQLHVAIEACRLAFADALAWVADPLVHKDVPLQQLVCADRGKQRYQQYYNPDKVGGTGKAMFAGLPCVQWLGYG